MKKLLIILAVILKTCSPAMANEPYKYCVNEVNYTIADKWIDGKYIAVTTQYTLVAAGGNYSVAATWSPAVVPTSEDNILCNASSGQLTIVATATITGIDFTLYTNTVTLNNTFTNSGNVTLGSGMTWTTTAGTPILSCNTTATLTSNTKTFPYALDLRGTSQTYTLADNWTVLSLTISSAVTSVTINGHILSLTTSFTTISGNLPLNGTTTLTFIGTGSWTGYAVVGCNLTFNTAGTITLVGGSGFVQYGGTGTMTWVSGTIVSTGCSLCTVNTPTLNIGSSVIFSSVIIQGSTTLLNDLYVTNFNPQANAVGAYNVYVAGNLTIGGAGAGANIILNGTGTVSSTVGSSYFGNSGTILINTAGTITFSGDVKFGTSTLTYSTAASVVTSGSTLNCWASTPIFNTNGITWNNVTFQSSVGANLTSNLSATGTMNFLGSSTITGAGVFTTANLTCTVAGANIKLVAAQTYTVTGVLTLQGTSGSHVVIKSSIGSTAANLTMSGVSAVYYTDATDINSTSGNPVYDYTGTLLRDYNWVSLSFGASAY